MTVFSPTVAPYTASGFINESKAANTVCQPYSRAEGNQGITKACEEGKENGGDRYRFARSTTRPRTETRILWT